MSFMRMALATILSLSLAAATWAQAPSELLEKGIYAEETQGDLAAAIKIYERISGTADAERATVAQALFRLGMCYLKSGRKAEATAAFQKLAKDYADQKALVAKIPAQATAHALLPAPWPVEETLVLRAKMEGSPQGGIIVFRVQETDVAGRRAYRLDTYRPGNLFTQVHVDADTFQPIDGRAEIRNLGVRTRSLYSPGGVELTRWEKEEPKKQQVSFSRAVYDNEEVVQMIRRLPLAEGYTTNLTVMGIGAAVLIDVKLDVVGRETVTVPAGTYETYKVNLGIHMDGRHVQDQKLWYSADDRRYPVKMENIVTLELTEIMSGPRSGNVAFEDAATGVSLSAPAGWLLVNAGGAAGQLHAHVLAPEMTVTGGLHRLPPTKHGTTKTAQQMADEHVEWGQQKFKVYALRGAAEAFDLNGQPATKLTADYTHPVTGRGMVEHRVFVAHQGHRVSLDFDVEKERWDSVRPALDEIVRSLRLR
jgi:hypothetical protein